MCVLFVASSAVYLDVQLRSVGNDSTWPRFHTPAGCRCEDTEICGFDVQMVSHRGFRTFAFSCKAGEPGEHPTEAAGVTINGHTEAIFVFHSVFIFSLIISLYDGIFGQIHFQTIMGHILSCVETCSVSVQQVISEIHPLLVDRSN